MKLLVNELWGLLQFSFLAFKDKMMDSLLIFKMAILRSRRTGRNESIYKEIRFYILNSSEIRASRLGCYLIGLGSCWLLKFSVKNLHACWVNGTISRQEN